MVHPGSGGQMTDGEAPLTPQLMQVAAEATAGAQWQRRPFLTGASAGAAAPVRAVIPGGAAHGVAGALTRANAVCLPWCQVCGRIHHFRSVGIVDAAAPGLQVPPAVSLGEAPVKVRTGTSSPSSTSDLPRRGSGQSANPVTQAPREDSPREATQDGDWRLHQRRSRAMSLPLWSSPSRNLRTLTGAVRTPGRIVRTPGGGGSYRTRSGSHPRRRRRHNARSGRAVLGEESSLMVSVMTHNTVAVPRYVSKPSFSTLVVVSLQIVEWVP